MLIATIVLAVCMPALCWIAPEIPSATYSWGATDTPVWPTWNDCGTYPASTAARDAPTAAPSASARSSTSANFSSDPSPRPPETTFAAPRSSGRDEVTTAASTAPTVAAFCPDAVTASVSTSGEATASARASIAP